MDDHDLIHDWNEAGERWEKPAFEIQFDDETLRDGLQSPSVKARSSVRFPCSGRGCGY